MPSLGEQITYLFLLALAIACVAWTVTHEEVFREPREYCVKKSKEGKTIFSTRCAGCHNVNKTLTGPALAGVDQSQ